jgi:hypothetical protein
LPLQRYLPEKQSVLEVNKLRYYNNFAIMIAK